MAHDHCSAQHLNVADKQAKFALQLALAINLLMFFVEVISGALSGSLSLLSDSLDFLSDSATYAISIYALSKSLTFKARVSQAKSLVMMAYGIFILVLAIYKFNSNQVPHYDTMGIISVLALIANLISAYALFGFRNSDSNLRSVWLCSRNDAINNIAIIIAAFLVFWTNSGLPDLFVASIIAILELYSARQIFKQAREEIKSI